MPWCGKADVGVQLVRKSLLTTNTVAQSSGLGRLAFGAFSFDTRKNVPGNADEFVTVRVAGYRRKPARNVRLRRCSFRRGKAHTMVNPLPPRWGSDLRREHPGKSEKTQPFQDGPFLLASGEPAFRCDASSEPVDFRTVSFERETPYGLSLIGCAPPLRSQIL